MSRRDFRAAVVEPRPTSAWAMVTVASATLWITGQLDAWAMGVQAALLLLSLARRTRPFSWQQSPLALNLGMIGVASGTIVVALRGEPSTVALAHFAALVQGLQLVDARPRRTEFLLVAMALFQVVLASNLTDSVLFTPLLLAFLLATVWTLLVHTLRSEALEAGEAHELSRAFTPGLIRTTLIATVCSVLLALVLFVMLPRMRSSVVTGGALGPRLATAGFSETVAFGALGRIRQDPTVVLRVETLEGEAPAPDAAYWRGLAFDRFDGTAWSIHSPERLGVPGTAESGVELGSGAETPNRVQRIVREPVEGSVLFAVGRVRAVQGTIPRLRRDRDGGLYAHGQDADRVRYTVRSIDRTPGDGLLRRDHGNRDDERWLQLPALSPAIAELAQRITRDATTDADRARAIERHLLRHGHYSDTPPEPGTTADSPIEGFLLGDMAGHCEYFATAMVLLAREVGLPARLVNGFAGGRENRFGGFLELTRSDAHAWAEVRYAGAGWVRYDPTPADLRARPEEALSLAMRMRDLGSALELWWFQRVVGFDRSDQMDALKRAWLAWRGSHRRGEALAEQGRDGSRFDIDGSIPWREGGVVALCLAAAVGFAVWIARRRRPGRRLPDDYARALRIVAGAGLRREAHVPARDFADTVAAELPDAGSAAFRDLTETYLATRFGGRAGSLQRGRAPLQVLRRSVRDHRRARPMSRRSESVR